MINMLIKWYSELYEPKGLSLDITPTKTKFATENIFAEQDAEFIGLLENYIVITDDLDDFIKCTDLKIYEQIKNYIDHNCTKKYMKGKKCTNCKKRTKTYCLCRN